MKVTVCILVRKELNFYLKSWFLLIKLKPNKRNTHFTYPGKFFVHCTLFKTKLVCDKDQCRVHVSMGAVVAIAPMVFESVGASTHGF